MKFVKFRFSNGIIERTEMSFLKLESECADGGTTGGNCLDTFFGDAKTTHDVSFYKDVIKRLQEELSKMKTENLQLRETILAYSIKLPQVSRKLNTLVTCLEAKAYKFSRRKTRKSKDEPEDSPPSGESSLNGEDDGECDLQDEASDEETSQPVGSTPGEGVHHSVQSFVEIVCEEDISVENGSSTNEVNNAAAGNENPKSSDRQKKDNFLENNTKSSTTNTRGVSFRNIKIRKSKGSKILREILTKKNIKLKKPAVQNANQNEQAEEYSVPTKEIKTMPEPVYEVLRDDDVDIKIKMEESLEDSPLVENDTQETGKRSKPQKQSQGSVISVSSTPRPTSTTENTGNNSTDLRRRGRRRAYDCEVCGRTFARSSNLAHHVMRHRNERPHQCEICDRAFVQKANLKVHLRSHTGERPFSCNECGRAFAQKNNALRHLRAHARQRQLQEQKLVCPVCGKSFGRWPSYETHMRRAHSNTESNTIVPLSHCIVDGMVNDSHPNEAQPGVGDISGGPNISGVNIPHHVGNTITSSQLTLEHSSMENIHPTTVSMVNVHANDNLNNGHLPPGHHPPSDHLLVGSHATITAQLSGAHSCSDSAC